MEYKFQKMVGMEYNRRKLYKRPRHNPAKCPQIVRGAAQSQTKNYLIALGFCPK